MKVPRFTSTPVVIAVLAFAAGALANPAPLDTLVDAETQSVQDERYAAPEMNISRKLMPEVTASEGEKTASPKRPPRLDDPLAGAWRFHLARQAALTDNSAGVSENLTAALQANPGQARYQWWQSLQALKGFDAVTLAKVLPASFRSLMASPTGRGHFLVAGQQAAVIMVACFWLALVGALYLALWRFMAHDLAGLILKNPSHRPRVILPLLLPLIILLFKPGLLGFLAAMSMPLLVLATGRTRALLLSTWAAALILIVPSWPMLRSAVPTVDPASEVTLLEKACTLPPSNGIIRELQTRIEESTDPGRTSRLTVALAIQEARRGNYTRSNRLFSKVLETDQNNFPSLVGVANNTYYQGRLEDAARDYRKAALAHPERGEVPYNLAQVYFKKLFVPEATEAMDKARSLGFDPPAPASDENRRRGYAPVVYPPLTNRSMQQACDFEAGNYPSLVTLSSWRWILGTPPLPLHVLVGAPFLIALLVMMWGHRSRDPRECENCGTPLCRTCSVVHETAWLCSGCGETAERSRSEMVLATLLKNRSRAEGMANAHRIIRLGRLVPGAGHFATGRIMAGWLRVSLVAVGLFLMVGGWAFDLGADWTSPGILLDSETIHPYWAPLPAALWPGWTGLGVLVGGALLIVAWILAFVDGPSLRRGIPDRYTLSPAGNRPVEAGIRPGAR
jgi:tetratricopeptide (TPR) repeat protein